MKPLTFMLPRLSDEHSERVLPVAPCTIKSFKAMAATLAPSQKRPIHDQGHDDVQHIQQEHDCEPGAISPGVLSRSLSMGFTKAPKTPPPLWKVGSGSYAFFSIMSSDSGVVGLENQFTFGTHAHQAQQTRSHKLHSPLRKVC